MCCVFDACSPAAASALNWASLKPQPKLVHIQSTGETFSRYSHMPLASKRPHLPHTSLSPKNTLDSEVPDGDSEVIETPRLVLVWRPY